MLLVIARVYNNNTALVNIGDGKQAIVQGKGIGFKKRRGDSIPATDAEKIFYLDNPEVKHRFTSLLKDVPIDIVTTCFAVIEMAKSEYHYSVLSYIYVTLTDHVAQMYKRLMKGTYKPSPVPDIHDRYPTEYQIATEALAMINRGLNVHFPNNEINSLALHFINAQGTDPDPQPEDELSVKVNKIVQQVFAEYGIARNLANANYFDRLMIHLQYLVERLHNHEMDDHVLSANIESDFHRLYPKSFEIATKVCDDLEAQLEITLNENERVYFIIHVQRLIQETADTPSK
ncbi:MAG: PRD domain-containing protein [Schleiferilactobacillus harbinensis]|jgi:transcriptional antiterminator|nr:PRD domain-containing protein [Schleiferilactobacillus harbinensis]MCI1913289.1 PRD domain-containing protein [Schleiferilactobacillus harbinensis]